MANVFPVRALVAGYSETIIYTGIVNSFGGPYEERIITSPSFTHSDATTGKRRHTFKLGFIEDRDVDTLWTFYKAEMEANWRAFSYYPRQTPPGNDSSATNRYLVRFENPSLTRDDLSTDLANMTLSLIEVAS
jgi:hypothetical protein